LNSSNSCSRSIHKFLHAGGGGSRGSPTSSSSPASPTYGALLRAGWNAAALCMPPVVASWPMSCALICKHSAWGTGEANLFWAQPTLFKKHEHHAHPPGGGLRRLCTHAKSCVPARVHRTPAHVLSLPPLYTDPPTPTPRHGHTSHPVAPPRVAHVQGRPRALHDARCPASAHDHAHKC